LTTGRHGKTPFVHAELARYYWESLILKPGQILQNEALGVQVIEPYYKNTDKHDLSIPPGFLLFIVIRPFFLPAFNIEFS
jgi:hypothetical protein